MEEPKGALSGRRAEAARNDKQILDAARAVFIEDPEAPMVRLLQQARARGIAPDYVEKLLAAFPDDDKVAR